MKHSNQCTMAFGKFTKTDGQCPRCDELKQGAAPRAGWQKRYFTKKAEDATRFNQALEAHDCKASGCMIVCTFGDW